MGMSIKKVIAFTDGSSLGNPGPGGFGAVIIADDTVTELGGREKHTTNNRMELVAAIEALKFPSDARGQMSKVIIYTDSSYVINGITKWAQGWEQNGWKTKMKQDVLNRDLWEELLSQTRKIKSEIDWIYVPGHSGVPGNERVDVIGKSFAGGAKVKLYSGSIAKYPYGDITRLPSAGDLSSKKSGKAFSYISLVNGVVTRHKTWDECKECVSGKRAKFKKAFSEAHEKEILKGWGIDE